MVNFPTQIHDCDSHNPAFLDLSSDHSVCSTVVSIPLGDSDHVVISVSIVINILKLGTSVTAFEFCEWLQVEINVYIPDSNYQVKPHLSKESITL